MTNRSVKTDSGRSARLDSVADTRTCQPEIGRDGNRVVVAIEAVLKIVEEETAAIRAFGVREVEKFTERKGQALMGLTRIPASGQAAVMPPSTVAALKALRAALESNQAVLKIHIDAVTEVSQIIVRCVQNSTCDGTYSKPQLPYSQY